MTKTGVVRNVNVNVNISNNPGFGHLLLEVHFDHTKLQLVSFEKKIVLPDDYKDIGLNGDVDKANTTGSIKIKWEPELIKQGVFSTPVTFEGDALTLKYTILDTNAVGTEIPVTVAVKDCYIDDFDMTDVANTVVNGKVTVIACDHAGNTNELTETTAANCTTPGEKTGTCSVCGGALSEPIPVVADAHNFGEWNEVVPGTCTTPAKLERVCAHNAAHKETKDGALNPDNHAWGEYTETTPGTCTTPAKLTRVCSHDATHTETKDGALNPNNHDFGAWTEVTPGNCTTPAKLERVCSHNAAHKETKDGDIVADAHSFGEWNEVVPGTCTTPAKLERVCAHNAAHKETKDGALNPDNHAWGEYTETTPGTCTTPAKLTRVCSHDATHTETKDGALNPNNHDFGAWTEVTPGNCTTPAKLERVCSRDATHKETKDGDIVADAHSFGEWTEVTPGNCTTPAKLERVCAHNATHKETKDGAIVANKHSFGEWKEVVPGNCTTPAKLERVCANDASHTETKDGDIVADNHNFGEWTVTVKPTSTSEGEMTRVCYNNPAHVETVVLEKLGLIYESEDKTAKIVLDENSFVPKNSELEIFNVRDYVDDAHMQGVQKLIKDKTGKELALYYSYALVNENDMAVQIQKGTMTINLPTADNFENLKYYIISLDDQGLIDVTDKVVDGVFTYEAEEFGIVNLIVAGDKVVVEEDEDLKPEVKPEEKPEDKNPQNGDNAAIPFVLVATMLAAAAVMVIFKKKVNA